jgi:hypothetical protein
MIIKGIIGIIVGGLLGLYYYKKVGCPTGSCPITSNPYGSAVYGAFLGFFISTFF